MLCANCGAEWPEGVNFCEKCGTKLQQEEQSAKKEDLQQKEAVGESPKTGVAGEQKATKKASGSGVGRVLLSILLCLLIILTSVYTTAVFIIRRAVNEDSITNLVKEVKPAEVKVGFMEDGQNKTLAEYISEYSNRYFVGGLSVDETEELLQEKYIRKFITKKTNDYVNDILFDTGEGIIDIDEIEDLWLDNLDKINRVTKTYTSEEQVRLALKQVEKSKLLEETDISIYREDASRELSLIQNLLSDWIMVVGVLLNCVLLLGLFLTQDKKSKMFLYTGSCMVVTGGFQLLFSLLVRSCVSTLNTNISMGRNFWKQVIKPVQIMNLNLGIIFVVVGAVFWLIYILMKVIQNKTIKKSSM